MTRLAQTERAALCDTAVEVGAGQPTLSGTWTVKDLVVHLLVREGSPAAVGIVVAPLSGLTAAVSRRLARRDFPALVERLRAGPPRFSPFAVPRLDELGNSLEFFVHHEDIRRARPTWSPRLLGDETDRRLWALLPAVGRRLTRKAPVGVIAQHSGTGATAVLKAGTPMVTLRGLPGEIVLYVFGRSSQARVELLGEEAAVSGLRATSLGA